MLEWNGAKAMNAIHAALEDALLTCGADLQEKSVNRAPIDTGKLRENCVVDDAELSSGVVKVGYTHEVDEYSLIQHERLDFNHPRGGEAKYLENPFNENAQRYTEYIGEQIGEAIE